MAAAWPEADVKASYLDAIDDVEGSETSAMLKASMWQMFANGQESIHRGLGQRILQALPRLDKLRDQKLVGAYVWSLLPALCTAESVQALASAFADRESLGLIAIKALRVSHQEDQRCVAMAARELAAR